MPLYLRFYPGEDLVANIGLLFLQMLLNLLLQLIELSLRFGYFELGFPNRRHI